MILKLFKYTLILIIPVLFFTGFISFKTGKDSKSDNLLYSVQDTLLKDFVNYILNFHPVSLSDNRSGRNIENWLRYYRDSLHYNGFHVYGGFNNKINNEGSDKYGRFFSPLTGIQIENTRNLINQVQQYGMKGFFGRIKIEQLCYAQRIEYEVSLNGDSLINYGFCYRNIMPNSYMIDNDRTVLNANAGTDSAQWLCENIYENLQHGDLYGFVQADTSDWFVKPVMRIRKNDFNKTDTTKVAAIVIKNFSGITIDSVIIRINNFGSDSSEYSGEYTDSYNFPSKNLLQISGSTVLSNGLNKGIANHPAYWDWNSYCKIDFKIYWFGEVDIWFDKMIVDDTYSNDLFKGKYDYDIKQEDSCFAIYGKNKFFFVDEIVNSNIPCIKYVQDKLDYYSLQNGYESGIISFAVTNGLNIRGMKNDNIAFEMILNKMQPRIMSCDIHEFNNFCYPDVFESYDPILSNYSAGLHTSPANYNDSLQRLVFGDKMTINSEKPHGAFIYQIHLLRTQINEYSEGTRMIIQPQIHSWIEKESGQFIYKGLREPMNSEIEAQGMLAIAHGADGLNWFVFSSESSYGSSSPDSLINSFQYRYDGLINSLDKNFTKRTENWYGQNKWDYVSVMNSKILNWKSTIDKIEWKSGWSVHSEGANHEFISDIISIPRNSRLEYEESNIDETNKRYWEMGFFIGINPSNSNNKYFIMVNRRCIPEVHKGDGDYRELRIKFNVSNLPDYINWKVIDINTGTTVITINKNNNIYYNLGEFKPGEGRLFKLEPVQ